MNISDFSYIKEGWKRGNCGECRKQGTITKLAFCQPTDGTDYCNQWSHTTLHEVVICKSCIKELMKELVEAMI